MSLRVRGQQGQALFIAIAVMTIMLGLGLALLSVVDTQAQQSGNERVVDSAFNLAEGALSSESFLLSRAWPEFATTTAPGTGAACSQQPITGGLGTPADPTTPAGKVQALVSKAFTTNDYTVGATWTINVCDDTNHSAIWDDSLLAAPGFDANGPDASGIRRVWVRAQANVRGRRRAVAGLVQVNQATALPGSYGVLAGGFSTDLSMVTNELLTGSVASGVIKPLLANSPRQLVADGKIGVRCGLLSSAPCVTGAFTAITDTPLGPYLVANSFVQYKSPTAVGDAAIADFRRQAQTSGTYVTSLAAGANCLPAGSAGKVVFIEKVGNGDEACVIAASAGAKMLVVASGRVTVDGTAATASNPTTFTGVLYALNRQRDLTSPPDSGQREVVAIRGNARVVGAVIADGASGKVGIYPPKLQCITVVLVGQVCLVSQLVSLLGLQPLVSNFLGQLSGYGPAVQYNAAAVNAVTTYGSSGTVSGTFRQITPNAG